MWPAENPWPAVIACACVAVVCVLQWHSTRKSSALIIGSLFLVAGGGCLVWDFLVETPSELITRNIYAMTSAFQNQDANKTISFISNRCPARTTIELTVGRVKVTDLRISDIHVRFRAANSIAISHFRANATVSVEMPAFGGNLGHQPSRWELEWGKEAGEWKVIEVKRLNPITGAQIAFFAAE